MGVPPMHALAVAEQIQRHTRAIAESVRAPVRRGRRRRRGRPGEAHPQEWAQLSDALARLRPLATEAVRAAFQQTMAGVVERQLQKTLKRLSGRPARPHTRRVAAARASVGSHAAAALTA